MVHLYALEDISHYIYTEFTSNRFHIRFVAKLYTLVPTPEKKLIRETELRYKNKLMVRGHMLRLLNLPLMSFPFLFSNPFLTFFLLSFHTFSFCLRLLFITQAIVKHSLTSLFTKYFFASLLTSFCCPSTLFPFAFLTFHHSSHSHTLPHFPIFLFPF